MKKLKDSFVLTISILVLYSCNQSDSCSNNNIESFDHFLGLSRESRELDLVPRFGSSDLGYYTQDSSSFVYQYKKTENVPLTIWVNAGHGRIETIFLDVLGIGTFKEDIKMAKQVYDIDDCDSRFFGLTDLEIIEQMGKPKRVNQDDDGVKYLTYSSKDSKNQVEFRFYEEQDYLCSAISVNWLY